MKSSLEVEVVNFQNRFRNLKGWKIIVDETSENENQCYWDVKKKQAIIYKKTAPISDRIYAYHEMLHIVQMATFRGVSKYSRKKKEQLIETLIEDLTAILFLNT
jgi:hypothetical protein